MDKSSSMASKGPARTLSSSWWVPINDFCDLVVRRVENILISRFAAGRVHINQHSTIPHQTRPQMIRQLMPAAMGFLERVQSLPRLGLGVSTEYGAFEAPGGLDILSLRRSHPHFAGFLELGI